MMNELVEERMKKLIKDMIILGYATPELMKDASALYLLSKIAELELKIEGMVKIK